VQYSVVSELYQVCDRALVVVKEDKPIWADSRGALRVYGSGRKSDSRLYITH
jgi:hypothetical protein